MPVFTHQEFDDEDDGPGFNLFLKDAASEHWFPSLKHAALTLELEHIEELLHLLTAAETVAAPFGHSVTISGNHGAAYCMDVESPEDGEGFSPECHEVEFLVSRGQPGSVRWTVLHEYSSDKLLTQWLTRAQLEAMKSGVVPTFN
jgi:hypothetical protein